MSIDVADFTNAGASPQIVLASGSMAGAGGLVTVVNATLPVPAGTHALALVAARTAGGGTFTTIPLVTGHQSQYTYLSGSTAGQSAWRRLFPYLSGMDTSVEVNWNLNAPVGTTVAFYLIAILDSMVVWAWNNGLDAPLLGVQVFDSTGALLSLGQKTMAGSQGVAIASDQSSLPVNFGIGALAFTNISRAIGTYTFNLPVSNVGKGLIVRTFNNAGTTGTATPSIAENDNLGPGTFTLLSGVALAVGASSRMRVYPGLVAAANVAGNDLVGQGAVPIVQLVVATAATTCVVSYSSTQ